MAKSRTRSALKKILGKEYMKVKLSFLWIFAMLNYAYADIITLMDSEALSELMTGVVGGMHVTQGFLFWGAVLMEIPIAMILLSLFLQYKWNRRANIFAGIIKTAAVGWSLSVGIPPLYYIFFATIEMITTIVIVWLAWTWPNPERRIA